MRKWLLLALLAFLVVKYIEANPIGYQVYTQPGLGALNESQAALNNAQASQVNQAVRRQNEMDNGLGFNMLARIVTGRGITDAEQVASVAFSAFAVCGLAPAVLVVVVVALARLGRSAVRND